MSGTREMQETEPVTLKNGRPREALAASAEPECSGSARRPDRDNTVPICNAVRLHGSTEKPA